MENNSILSEFFSKVPKRWIMLVLIIADIIAISGTVFLVFSRLLGNEPLIFWFVISTIVLSVTLVVFSYFAFKDVAEERNKCKCEIEELKKQVVVGAEQALILTPRTYTIGLSSMTNYPDKPNGAYWLRLDISANAINEAIDTLDLIIDGKPIPADQWHSKIATSFFACFNVTDWKQKGIIQVDLQARIKGDVRSLVRIPIDFDIDPGGLPRQL